MPHVIREHHLDDLCSNCKQPHGGQIKLLPHGHKVYEIIPCQNCGYEIIKVKEEKLSNSQLDFI